MLYVVMMGAGLALGGVIGWWWSRSRLAALQTQLAQASHRMSQVNVLLSDMRRRLAETQVELQQARAATRTPDQEDAQLHAQMRQLQIERDRLVPRLAELEAERNQARQQVAVLQMRAETLRTRLPELEDDVVHTRQRAAAAETQIQSLFHQARLDQKRLAQVQRQLAQAVNRVDQLERVLALVQAEDRDGQSDSVHSLEDGGQGHCPDGAQPDLREPILEAEPAAGEACSMDLPELALQTGEEWPQVHPELAAIGPHEAELGMPQDGPVEAGVADAEPLGAQVELTAAEDAQAPPLDGKEGAPVVTEPEPLVAYCVKCKRKRLMRDSRPIVLADERPALKGTCVECGAALFRFIK